MSPALPHRILMSTERATVCINNHSSRVQRPWGRPLDAGMSSPRSMASHHDTPRLWCWICMPRDRVCVNGATFRFLTESTFSLCGKSTSHFVNALQHELQAQLLRRANRVHYSLARARGRTQPSSRCSTLVAFSRCTIAYSVCQTTARRVGMPWRRLSSFLQRTIIPSHKKAHLSPFITHYPCHTLYYIHIAKLMPVVVTLLLYSPLLLPQPLPLKVR